MLSSDLSAANRRTAGYLTFAGEARQLIADARRGGCREQLWSAELYWSLGRLIGDHQARQGWKGGVLKVLSEDLSEWFPGLAGLSYRNLQYMRAFAAAWPQGLLTEAGAGALPWGHITVLLDKVPDAARRDGLAAEALQYGWSRTRLQQHALAERMTGSGGQPGVDG
ncbi:MAG: hypothetical protein K0Q84_268 [Arthrobacter sp.]|jgi:hypothetical protein|nr:hypothetical protein [Arthrobacter sp.]